MEEKHLASGSDATEKLYYHDSHSREFTATVLSCEEKINAKGKRKDIGSFWTAPYFSRKEADSSGIRAGSTGSK